MIGLILNIEINTCVGCKGRLGVLDPEHCLLEYEVRGGGVGSLDGILHLLLTQRSRHLENNEEILTTL